MFLFDLFGLGLLWWDLLGGVGLIFFFLTIKHPHNKKAEGVPNPGAAGHKLLQPGTLAWCVGGSVQLSTLGLGFAEELTF